MTRITSLALVSILSLPLLGTVATQAMAEPAAAAADTMTKTSTMTDAEKRAKAADCSKQANEKGLHGTAREKFRAECKRK